MEPVSNADRLALLLRQKLEARAKASAARAQSQASPAAPSAVRAMAAIEGADERALRRAVIQNLLADQFGNALVNDAQFQQVVTRVTETIEQDEEAAKLLSQVIAQLRS